MMLEKAVDWLKGQASTNVVEAVVVMSHPDVVTTFVTQLADAVACAEPEAVEHVTYESYPVVDLLQLLEEDAEEDVLEAEVWLWLPVELESSSSSFSSSSSLSVSACTPSNAPVTAPTASVPAFGRLPAISESPFVILPRSFVRLPKSPPPPPPPPPP